MSLPSSYVPLAAPSRPSLAKACCYSRNIQDIAPEEIHILLSVIRLLDTADLRAVALWVLPPRLMPSTAFLSALPDPDYTTALRACLLVYTVTRGKIIPRELQLEAGIATANGRHGLVIAPTGWGKTMCIAIPILLCPEKITITISPLKRLQLVQVKEFAAKFGISTVAINEDTPNDPDLWNSIASGRISHLIVQPEQFRTFHGHLPKMARLLHDYKFTARVGRVAVDEAHNVHTAGLKLNGRAPFRPAWGLLGDVRAKLPKSTIWQALSATFPPHILKSVIESLSLPADLAVTKVSVNRKNLIYATRVLVNGRYDFRNLNMIFPDGQPFHPPMCLPHLLIFHDNKSETAGASQHLESRLPPQFRNMGICRHYHSDMSPEYLEQVYASFSDPDGDCLILNATQGAGEGLDVPGINGVINYGIPAKIPMKTQRDGRGGRSTASPAFCLNLIEPWVREMDAESALLDVGDPDRPLMEAGLTKKVPTKQERTGVASIHLANSDDCEREINADYYGDDSAEALEFTGPWCCDSKKAHPGSTFDLQKLFLGPLFVTPVITETRKRKAANKYRPTGERPALTQLLVDWLRATHAKSPLRFVRPPSFILDDVAIAALSRALPSSLSSAGSVTEFLHQTPEWDGLWAESVCAIIAGYKCEVVKDGTEEPAAKRTRRK
ncbi:P-loop containing nucleoside triphosphate hydrolase protein [Mycena metata]|uniref:DNA 3'-5' helicase n=1 Tax=Mycena metata TaxID=1033252 RepID=A0AAD7NPG1_9AGAR|nr:P-loop containing nucleoside triphosphate hydrolase protein [Mycena metata]